MAEDNNPQRPVRKLTVDNFSVIKHAELEFGKITVLIGPQASGKSLLCKLAYFFQKVFVELAEDSIREGLSFENFRVRVASEFTFNWFPVFGFESAAKIAYSDGKFAVSLSRNASSSIPDRPGIIKHALATVSDEVSSAYEMTLLQLKRESSSSGNVDSSRYSREIGQKLQSLQSPDAAIYSYIPSTRSFFISPQKAVIATSQRLDPITIRFSQDFALDFQKRIPQAGLKAELTSWIDKKSLEALQGEVAIVENGEAFETKPEFFKSNDGRLIPISFLSSGTQELLPLFTLLREYVGLSAAISKTLDLTRALHKRLIFIEEPETNIFPSTQNELVRILARLSYEPALDVSWVITTHSPYILTAFNNLIEAAQVAAAKPELKSEVAKLIPEHYWIKPADFKAYAIEDGVLKSIVAEDTGLVSANYLDQVSETIGAEFDELLRLGYVES